MIVRRLELVEEPGAPGQAEGFVVGEDLGEHEH